MRYRLIAMDMDGTLTNDRKQITKATLNLLKELQEQGVRLVLASARPSPGLLAESTLLEMPDHGGILMSYNGGRIVEAETGRILYETAIPLETARSVLKKLEEYPVTVILDDGEQFYVTNPEGYKVQYECLNNHMTCTKVENLADFISFEPVKFLMSVQPEQLKRVQEQIALWLPKDLVVVQTAAFYLEIIPASINKGEGLRQICRVTGIPLEETVAFGDSENDIPMLRAAGTGVAMGNADPEVKKAADIVTDSNNEDGIAHFLAQHSGAVRKDISWTSLLCVFLASVCFSTGGLFIKIIPWNALAINGARNLVGAIVIGLYLLLKRHRIIFNRQVAAGAASLIGVTTLFALSNKLTTAANAIVLQFTAPVFVIILMMILYGSKPRKGDVITCAVVLSGVCLFFVDGLQAGNLAGNITAVLSGICYAGVFMMNTGKHADALSSCFLGQLTAGVLFTPWCAYETDFSPAAVGAVLALGIIQVGGAYILLAEGIQKTPPVTASLITGLEPIMNPLWVALFYGEKISRLSAAGSVIVIVSIVTYNIWMGRRPARQDFMDDRIGREPDRTQ